MFRYRLLLGFMLLVPVLLARSYQPGAPAQSSTMEKDAVRAEDLVLLKERTRIFRVTDGESIDQRMPLTFRPSRGEEPGDWVMEFSDLNTVYLSVDDGRLMLERLVLPSDGLAVEYDTPVRMLPAEIRPHVQIKEDSKAQIYDLETGELERTGTVHHEVKLARRSRLSTDVGVYKGYRIPIKQEIDMGWTEVRLELTGGYVPEVGIVYRRFKYTLNTLGLFDKTILREAVLSKEA